MNEYHFTKLNKREQAFYRRVIDSIRQSEITVKALPFMDTDSITTVVTAINYDHPELFYVDFRNLHFYETPGGATYQINYLVKSALRKTAIVEAEEIIATIIASSQKANLKNDYDKCRWIHNFLVKNTRYNHDALRQPDSYPDAFTVIGTLTERYAVCEGISKTFKLLCDRLGVESLIAFGASSLEGLGEEIPHAWNIVKLDGEYTHIDVTWDIGVSEPCRHTRFDYFCLSDNQIRLDHVFDNLPNCQTETLSFFQKRNREFNSNNQLQKYLQAELKKGASVLYFKVTGSKYSAEVLTKRIQETVSKAVASNQRGSYFLEMAPNEKQQCYFFRITNQ